MELLTWLTVDDPTTGAAVLVAVHFLAALGTSGHILLHKDSERAATGWIALTWLSPLVGSLLYVLFGINRVHRKAVWLRASSPTIAQHPEIPPPPAVPSYAHLAPLRLALDGIAGVPLVGGNQVTALRDGEEAYPAMLEAIASAEHTIALQTFILDLDPWGERFIDALAAAELRGVDVKVLLDGVGVWFSFPHVALRRLRQKRVPFRRFLWTLDPRRMTLLNLRNHRKILVVDGRVGFTGGMNIRGSFVQEAPGPRTAEQDLHARVEGPLVRQLLDLFAADWAFTTGEWIGGGGWYPPLPPAGPMGGRVIPDGPDEHLHKAELTFIEAVACARRSVRIVTPYFIPENALELHLVAAARRGVAVHVIVPERGNHPLVDWTMRAELPRMLRHGVRVWMQPAPFDHTKLLVVDDVWCCLGSANWDPRSLRLNFEMLLEVYGDALAGELVGLFEEKRARSTEVRARDLLERPLWRRLRDGAARLLKPYL